MKLSKIQNPKSKIYLDHAATTPVDQEVVKAMAPFWSETFGNPASAHSFGQAAAHAVDEARAKIATLLAVQAEEIIFTSGATEANNLAVRGVVKAAVAGGLSKPHLIISAIEHESILATAADLVAAGLATVSYAPVQSDGVVDPEILLNLIQEQTILISLMSVNNETGLIQPVREVGKRLEKLNPERLKNGWPSIYLHCDVVQAVNFLDCRPQYLHADLVSLSGHKIYGSKGVGCLLVKNQTQLSAIQAGGGQERDRRSGTVAVPLVVGLAAALQTAIDNRDQNFQQVGRLRDDLADEIKRLVPEAIISGSGQPKAPGHLHVIFPNKNGEALVTALDLAGLAVSTGSACSVAAAQTSHVLQAMGVEESWLDSAVRFSVGKNNTMKEMRRVVEILTAKLTKI